MKKIIKKIVCLILLMVTVLSVLIVPASAAPYYPDGRTVTFTSSSGSERTTTISFRRKSDGLVIKTMVLNCAVGEYYVKGLEIYGYTPVEAEFPWYLLASAKVGDYSTNTISGGKAFYTQIGTEFVTGLSRSTYEGTLWFEADTCDITSRHILVGPTGATTVYYSNTLTYTYDTLFSTYSKNIPGYTLLSNYESDIFGYFTWDLLDSCANIPSKNYSATLNTTSADRNYYENRKLNVDFKYKINSYTVNYHAEGGTGAPASQTKYYGVDLQLSSVVPTKEGYNFVGWGYVPDDTSVEFYPGSIYKSEANLDLYAIWSHAGYTVKYDANGGTGAPASQIKYIDEPLTLRTTKPTREGYTFGGWATTNGEIQAVKYVPGGTYVANAPVTLYAVWRPNVDYYVIGYDANGGTGEPSIQTKTSGVDLTLSTTRPTRSGYTFLGWSRDANATTPTYYPGSTFTEDLSVTLYAVWEKLPETYTIRYNANGGTGAPATQTKTEGVSITLSSTVPTRDGYKFLGWSKSSTASSATYQPGATYSDNASVTLYAVWRKDNYDISASNLTVGSTTLEQYSSTTVSVRVDNWCRNNAYSNIPVELLYNGEVVATKNINLSVYGIATVNFTLNVGSPMGENYITARVNWDDRNNETDPNDNSVSTTINVTPYEYDLYINDVAMNAQYREGTNVITSFMIYNDREQDILPEHNNTVLFRAYYYDENGTMKTITQMSWSQAVIPAKNSNIVYFRWKVPVGLAGKTVYLKATVNSAGNVNESDTSNNTIEYTKRIIGALDSQPMDTNYGNAPDGFEMKDAPNVSYGTATWNQWVYSDGELVLQKYGLGISTVKPKLSPSESVSTAVQNGNEWTIKSGYGVEISYAPYLRSLSGYLVPSGAAFTGIQTVYAMFPEFQYSTRDGCIAVLTKNGSIYEFVPSDYSVKNESVHFIPVWMENGSYDVAVYAGEVWTPAGMIYTVISSDNMTINGTLYDDFYVGEQ